MEIQLQSTELKELFTALAKAQAEMEIAYSTGYNPYFKSKYATLKDMVKASRPALTKYGLSVTQGTVTIDGTDYLLSTLGHSSGQFRNSIMKSVPQKQDVQSLGSHLSYLQRYAYKTLVGVVVSDEEDDDGEVAIVRQPEKKTAPPSNYISSQQLKDVSMELIGNKELYNKIVKRFNSLQNIPSDQYEAVLKYIKEEKAKVL